MKLNRGEQMFLVSIRNWCNETSDRIDPELSHKSDDANDIDSINRIVVKILHRYNLLGMAK